jgi:hypothetical protein
VLRILGKLKPILTKRNLLKDPAFRKRGATVGAHYPRLHVREGNHNPEHHQSHRLRPRMRDAFAADPAFEGRHITILLYDRLDGDRREGYSR